MQYFFVQQTSENLSEVRHREFATLAAAQRTAIASMKDLISDAMLLGRSPDDISIEIWEESGGVVSVVQGSDRESPALIEPFAG